MDQPLFPELEKELNEYTDEELAELLEDYKNRVELIKADDTDFLGDLAEDVILAQMRVGVDTIKALQTEQTARVEAHENYVNAKNELAAELEVKAEAPEDEEAEPPAEGEEAPAEGEEAPAEGEEGEEAPADDDEEQPEAKAEDRELVMASGEAEGTASSVGTSVTVQAPRLRRPPAPAPDRIAVVEQPGVALMAAGELSFKYREGLNPDTLAELIIASAMHHGPHPKVDAPGKYRFGGPEHRVAHAEWEFPSDRQLLPGDLDGNTEKIREVIVAGIPGGVGRYSLTASGGLCAPLEPIYSMPNFASDAEPVWGALPKFQAARGGVNVPEATTIGDITTAISSISEANDALGGTFATKSCQDLTCPSYTEVAVQILAHCREYGNLNARAWPEKIRHENELTMAALARTSEMFMLERIKALSVNVTSGAATLSGLSYLVDAIVKSRWGIRGRLRMENGVRFRALLPIVMIEMLLLDTVQTIDGNRFKTRDALAQYLSDIGIDVVWYMDGDFAAGDDMTPDASQAAGALDPWPNTFQWALYPEGMFLGIDMGVLELGIVRDSTLNSTNDFQVFGEKFRNLARIGPAQGAHWHTTTLCAIGQFPPAGTARTCES